MKHAQIFARAKKKKQHTNTRRFTKALCFQVSYYFTECFPFLLFCFDHRCLALRLVIFYASQATGMFNRSPISNLVTQFSYEIIHVLFYDNKLKFGIQQMATSVNFVSLLHSPKDQLIT